MVNAASSNRHVVFDLETTGLWPQRHGHCIIEIGAVVVEHDAIVAVFDSLIDCGSRIPPEVQAIHGITPEMIAGQPKPEEILPLFKTFISDSPLVAHNAAFDLRFLRREFALLGMNLPNSHICTLNLSRRLLKRLPDYSLATVYQHLFPEERLFRQSHRALDDARITARVWMKLMERQKAAGTTHRD